MREKSILDIFVYENIRLKTKIIYEPSLREIVHISLLKIKDLYNDSYFYTDTWIGGLYYHYLLLTRNKIIPVEKIIDIPIKFGKNKITLRYLIKKYYYDEYPHITEEESSNLANEYINILFNYYKDGG